MALVRVNQLLIRKAATSGGTGLPRLRMRATATIVTSALYVGLGTAALSAVAALTPNATAASPAFAERMTAAAATTVTATKQDLTVRALGPHYLTAQAEMESNPKLAGDADQTWMAGVARCFAVVFVRNTVDPLRLYAAAEVNAFVGPPDQPVWCYAWASCYARLPPPRAPWYVTFGMAECSGYASFRTPSAKYVWGRALVRANSPTEVLTWALPDYEDWKMWGSAYLQANGVRVVARTRSWLFAEADIPAASMRDYVFTPELLPSSGGLMTGRAQVVASAMPILYGMAEVTAEPALLPPQVAGANPVGVAYLQVTAEMRFPVGTTITMAGAANIPAPAPVRITPSALLEGAAAIPLAKPKDILVNRAQRLAAVAGTTITATLDEFGADATGEAEVTAQAPESIDRLTLSPIRVCWTVITGYQDKWVDQLIPKDDPAPGDPFPFNKIRVLVKVPVYEEREGYVPQRIVAYGGLGGGEVILPEQQPWESLSHDCSTLLSTADDPTVRIHADWPGVVAQVVTPSTAMVASAACGVDFGTFNPVVFQAASTGVEGRARLETPGYRIGMSVWFLAKAEFRPFADIVHVGANHGTAQHPPGPTWDTWDQVWDEILPPWDFPFGEFYPVRGIEAEAHLYMPMRAAASLGGTAVAEANLALATLQSAADASAAGATMAFQAGATITSSANTVGSLMSPNTLVLLNMEQNPVVDQSMYDMAVNGNALLSSTAKFGTQAVQFMGSRAQWVDVDYDFTSTTSVKIEGWARAIFGTRTIFRSGAVTLKAIDNDLQLEAGGEIDVAAGAVPFGTYKHLTVVITALDVKLYVDGALTLTLVASVPVSFGRVILGNSATTGLSEPGQLLIDSVRLRFDDTTVIVPTAEYGF